ncbi:SulP family inorganic anion transporter [Sulfuriferula nivalis]|uniref:Sodium-independent anion transporter n=1 Tax=Sulfuriferula nivalis TaxID=2675298 RepID=A0A809SG31_9PROT|nr:SulP family inorganic anion transporter [Sulfuriferula nivalis]BBO99569.1 sodium-independent anion transporter [Sulfuriferula nivalis]
MIVLVEAYRAGLFKRYDLFKNVLAGVIVGIVALPLAMAFAIASGAKPEQGIYTAIIASLVTSVFGGSRVQISGPTGAFIVILAGITAKYGYDGLQIATLMAGVILIAMGFAKFGTVIRYIPKPVITGFTTGIAVLIWVGEWKDFFGLHPAEMGTHFRDKLIHLLMALPTLHIATTLLAVLGLAILIIAPRFVKRVPAPLIAMVVVTLVQYVGAFPGVATIGSAFGGIPSSLPGFHFPAMTYAQVVELIGPAFTIALLGAIESLLSAVVADGMACTKHNSNQELIGQGAANVLSPIFGGFAATGAIARTATNIRNGATSPLAGIIHALTLVLIVVMLAPFAAYIPLAALAAILFVVAWNMSEIHHFIAIARHAPKNDRALLLITFTLTVFTDLVIAVNVGVMLAALLFMKQMTESVKVQGETDESMVDFCPVGVPKGVQIYSIDGPFFFGAASSFESTLASLHESMTVLIIRMGRVPFIDVTGIYMLRDTIARFQKRGVRVILCEANPIVQRKLAQSGVDKLLGDENWLSDVSMALSSLPVIQKNVIS